MPSLQAALTELFGATGALMLFVTMLLMIFATPVIICLSVRFLWRPRVELVKSRELDALTLQLHRIASALEAQVPHREGALVPLPELPDTSIGLSMFGR